MVLAFLIPRKKGYHCNSLGASICICQDALITEYLLLAAQSTFTYISVSDAITLEGLMAEDNPKDALMVRMQATNLH